MPDVQFNFQGLDSFQEILNRWRPSVRKKTGEAMRDISAAWQSEAQKRIPVDTGLTRNTVLRDYGQHKNGEFYAACGSNQEHAKFLEYGTKHIAGGKVKALGQNPEITDQQAVHTWPAKERDADKTTRRDGKGRFHKIKGGSTSASFKGGALRNAKGRFVRGGAQEQMPWLRPAWMAIKEKAIGRLAKALQLD